MPTLVDRIRFHWARLLYDAFIFVMVRDASWQQALYDSLGPAAKKRILRVGAGSASAAIGLATRFPDAEIVAVDPDLKAVRMARQMIVRRHISNLTVIEGPQHDGRLPFDASSFDKVVVVLTLHDRNPDEKVSLARELLRILRHGGSRFLPHFALSRVCVRERSIAVRTKPTEVERRTVISDGSAPSCQSESEGSGRNFWAR
jgi:ubiquinone/menaquinone biosynthesis C-methylase UbiE